MAETLMFLVFCLLIFFLIGYSVFTDDAEDFWPERPERRRFSLRPKKRNKFKPNDARDPSISKAADQP